MTIQVKISHGDSGHPAPFFVYQVNEHGKEVGAARAVRDGEEISLHVHKNLHLVVTERPPESF